MDEYEYFSTLRINRLPYSTHYEWSLRSLDAYQPLASTTRDAFDVKSRDWISGRTRKMTHKKLYRNTAIQLYAYYKNTLTVLDGGHSNQTTEIVYFADDEDVDVNDFTVLLALFILILCSVYLVLNRFVTKCSTALFTPRFWFYHTLCLLVVAVASFVTIIIYLTKIHAFNGSVYTTPVWSHLDSLSQGYRHTTNLLATLVFLVLIRVSNIILKSGSNHKYSNMLRDFIVLIKALLYTPSQVI